MFGRRLGVVSPGPGRWGFLAVAAMGALAAGGPWARAQNQIWAVPGGTEIRAIEPVFRMHQGSPSLLAVTDRGRRLVRWHLDLEGRPHSETIAGTGGPGDAPDGTPAAAAAVDASAIARNAGGEIFFLETSKHRVRKIGLDRRVWTVAGTGTAGRNGDGGPGTLARLDRPQGLVASEAGDLYIADTENHMIRKLAADGTITRFAGTGDPGDGLQPSEAGPGIRAQIRKPMGLAIRDGELHLSQPAWFGGEVCRVSLATGRLEPVRRVALNARASAGNGEDREDHYVCSALALTATGETSVVTNNDLYMKGSFRVVLLPSAGEAHAHQVVAGTRTHGQAKRWLAVPGFQPVPWEGRDPLTVGLGRIRSLMAADGVGWLLSDDDAGLRFIDGVIVPMEARLTVLEREGRFDQVQSGILELRRQALGRSGLVGAQLRASSAQHIPQAISSLVMDYETSDPQAEMMSMFRARLRLHKIGGIPRLRRFLGQTPSAE